MRVLIVFHGWLPRDDRPGSGGAIRAWHHGEALRAAGHEVLYVTRDQDSADGGPPTFANASELRRYAKAVRPDRIVCVQPEEAPALRDIAPLCVDLYAPRLLESAWQDQTEDAAVETLRAIASADEFLFSNTRQRWFYLGLLSLAGVDLRASSGRVVPLVAPDGPRRRIPKRPVLVMGGVSWPWQDPREAIARTQEHLEKRKKGKLVVIGGRPAVGDCAVVDLPAEVPASKRLEYVGNLPYSELLKAYAGATAALDVMAPNPERELALAFRHVDYLGCGLPVITRGDHALDLGDAGWVVGDDLEEVLDEVLSNSKEVARRSKAAAARAQDFSRSNAEAALVDWVECAERRERGKTPLLATADARAHIGELSGVLQSERTLRHKAEVEVADKRAENERLADQIATLTGTIERLTRTLDEVAGFKREAIRVLGAEGAAASEEAKALSREVADMRADLAKKDVELRTMIRERDQLNDAMARMQDESGYAGERLLEAGSRESTLRADRDVWKERAEAGVMSRLLGRLRRS